MGEVARLCLEGCELELGLDWIGNLRGSEDVQRGHRGRIVGRGTVVCVYLREAPFCDVVGRREVVWEGITWAQL